MEVKLDSVIFQVVTPEGHLYKVYLNGRTEGFPANSVIVNKALPMVHALAKGQCKVVG